MAECGVNRTEATKERLARELVAAGHIELSSRAQSGQFGDYESEHAQPKRLLVGLLQARGDKKFAERVMAGEFDETKEEAAAWFECEGRDWFQQ